MNIENPNIWYNIIDKKYYNKAGFVKCGFMGNKFRDVKGDIYKKNPNDPHFLIRIRNGYFCSLNGYTIEPSLALSNQTIYVDRFDNEYRQDPNNPNNLIFTGIWRPAQGIMYDKPIAQELYIEYFNSTVDFYFPTKLEINRRNLMKQGSIFSIGTITLGEFGNQINSWRIN